MGGNGLCCNGKSSLRKESTEKHLSEDVGVSTPRMSHRESRGNLPKFLKELECPICFNTCIPPIQTCLNGHIICVKCRRGVLVCPTCREPYKGTRNFFAESFVRHHSQPCKFTKEGCKFLRWKGDNMKPHEKNCEFRPLNCLVASCCEEKSYGDLLNHLVLSHDVSGTDKLPARILYQNDQNVGAEGRKWVPYFIKAYGQLFYVMMEILRPQFFVWVWTQKFNNEDEKETETLNQIYIASIRFKNEDKNLCIGWNGPVQSVRTPSRNIVDLGLCFIGPEVIMRQFEKEGSITIDVNIEQKRINQNLNSPTQTKSIAENNNFGDMK